MSEPQPRDETVADNEPVRAADPADDRAVDGTPGDTADDAPDDTAGGAVDRPRRVLMLLLVAVSVFAADVITKIVAVSALENREPVELFDGLVYLQLIRNPGAAFSMATGMTWVFTVIATGVVVAIVWIAPKMRSRGWAVGLGLVLAGALGNLIDRLFRSPGPLRGHVVDFVSVIEPNGAFFPVFNVADAAISVGGVLIVVMALLGRDYDGRSTKDGAATTAAAESR